MAFRGGLGEALGSDEASSLEPREGVLVASQEEVAESRGQTHVRSLRQTLL